MSFFALVHVFFIIIILEPKVNDKENRQISNIAAESEKQTRTKGRNVPKKEKDQMPRTGVDGYEMDKGRIDRLEMELLEEIKMTKMAALFGYVLYLTFLSNNTKYVQLVYFLMCVYLNHCQIFAENQFLLKITYRSIRSTKNMLPYR